MSAVHSEIPDKTDSLLPPNGYTGFLGQESVRRGIELMVKGVPHGDVLGHILLTGPSGFGKRTLARMIANAMGVNIKYTSGPVIGKAGSLAGLLAGLEKTDVLFIDEIDRLQPDILEYLYSSLRDFEINIIIEDEPKARSLRLPLPKFTLVGASAGTDRIGARLLACFAKTFQFDRYTSEELQTILLRYAETIGVSIDQRAALEIALRADGSPVDAKNLFRRVRDFAEVRDGGKISHSVAERALTVFLREVNKGDFPQCTETAQSPIQQECDHPRFAALDLEARDPSFEASLRPSTFNEFVGQETVCERLQVMIDAAQQRGDVLDHTLVSGELGLGKTTLAHVIASAMGVNIVAVDAANILDTAHLSRLITSLERGGILLIEELHRLTPALEKDLQSAMEEFFVDIILDDGPQARSRRVQLPKFSLIGITPGMKMIGDSLRSRFGATFRLGPYSEAELLRVITRTAGILSVALDQREALDFATRSYGSPRTANNLLRLATPRLRLISAFAKSEWDRLPSLVTEIFWRLAQARPDFEELPDWIIDGESAINREPSSRQAPTTVAVARAIVRSLADRYGDDADRVAINKWESAFLNSDPQAATFLCDGVEQAKHFREGVQRLPLVIHNDEVCVGKHARISFNRTLRVPEDGKAYPLPAGFGRLPILRVEDYATKVPAKWVSEGGFIIPLYQREALFLEFSGVPWRPAIAKVSVGRVNAVSGKPHDLAIRRHRQDYVVIPDQKWLDGINTGKGSVSQFVAMPLGEGYTIEAQITDEEKHGGVQLVIYDPKAGRFDEQDPGKRTAAAASRSERAMRAKQRQILDSFPGDTRKLVRLLNNQHYIQAAELLERTAEDVLNEIRSVRSKFEELLGPSGFDGIVPGKNLEPPDLSLRAQSTVSEAQFMPSGGEPLYAARPVRTLAATPVKEMGIAAGGRITQQILDDEYGADSWDPKAYRDIVIHIVNSAVFEEITGTPPPESPITVSQYQRYKIPWYSKYDEKATTVSPARIFRTILSLGQVDKRRGLKEELIEPARLITEQEIIRVRVPSLEDRVNALVKRAQKSLHAGRYQIAAREASLASDIVPSHPLPLLLRAHANLRLGFHSDAEADASACLERDPNNLSALGVRALSCLGLGELLLAKNDASKVLESDPNDRDALFVRAQANLDLLQYKEAFDDANKLLEQDSSNAQAMRIKADAMTKLS